MQIPTIVHICKGITQGPLAKRVVAIHYCPLIRRYNVTPWFWQKLWDINLNDYWIFCDHGDYNQSFLKVNSWAPFCSSEQPFRAPSIKFKTQLLSLQYFLSSCAGGYTTYMKQLVPSSGCQVWAHAWPGLQSEKISLAFSQPDHPLPPFISGQLHAKRKNSSWYSSESILGAPWCSMLPSTVFVNPSLGSKAATQRLQRTTTSGLR